MLIAKNTGQRVLAAVVFKNSESKSYLLRLSLPHGLLLPEGVELWVDDGQRAKHVITTADQNGSYTTVPVDDGLATAMKKGALLNVAVKAVSGDTVILQLSLTGFAATLEKI